MLTPNSAWQELADFLVEKIQAKYEFYAAQVRNAHCGLGCLQLMLTVVAQIAACQVHRNAYAATTALLRQNLCVEEFESNLATITHLSQSRHDSIYRADARKVSGVRCGAHTGEAADRTHCCVC